MFLKNSSFSTFLLAVSVFCPASSEDLIVDTLETPAIEKQKTAVWCWAASIQNALASYDVSTTQEEVVIATYGRVVNLPAFDSRQAVFNLLSHNHKVAPEGKVVHPFFVAGPIRPCDLLREISREKSPLLVFYRSSATSGHVVVCYGIGYSGSESFPVVSQIFIKDSWEGVNKVWRGGQLASLWNATIFLRVAPAPPQTFIINNVRYSATSTFDVINFFSGMVEGRLWYFKERSDWYSINAFGQEFGPLSD